MCGCIRASAVGTCIHDDGCLPFAVRLYIALCFWVALQSRCLRAHHSEDDLFSARENIFKKNHMQFTLSQINSRLDSQSHFKSFTHNHRVTKSSKTIDPTHTLLLSKYCHFPFDLFNYSLPLLSDILKNHEFIQATPELGQNCTELNINSKVRVSVPVTLHSLWACDSGDHGRF